MKTVKFIAKSQEGQPRDGEAGWIIKVDGKEVAEVDNDELDVGDQALDPLWEALGIEVKFDFEANA